MPMQAESLEVLEKANLPSAQARAIVRAIEIEIAGAADQLATKHDLFMLRHDLRLEITDLGVQLRKEIADLRDELRKEIADLREELRKEIADLREELRKEIGDLRAEMHRAISGLARQFYLAILGQTAVMLGFAYFLVTQLR
jgi:predicted  nucleic acid-binding Zn-ribbon protein